jgi:hypothetical protein
VRNSSKSTRRLFLAAIPLSGLVAVAAVRGDEAMYVGESEEAKKHVHG